MKQFKYKGEKYREATKLIYVQFSETIKNYDLDENSYLIG